MHEIKNNNFGSLLTRGIFLNGHLTSPTFFIKKRTPQYFIKYSVKIFCFGETASKFDLQKNIRQLKIN
jgi:hypothetical protein